MSLFSRAPRPPNLSSPALGGEGGPRSNGGDNRRSGLGIIAALSVAVVAIGAAQFTSLDFSRAALQAHTSSGYGAYSVAMVVEPGHFGIWVYSSSSTAVPDGNNIIEPSDNPVTGRWILEFGFLSGTGYNATICSSGCTYTSLNSAYAGIQTSAVAPQAVITFNIPSHPNITSSGYPGVNAALEVDSRVGGFLNIYGAAPLSHTVTSIIGTPSATTAPNGWSVTFQAGEDVSNITAPVAGVAQDYFLIQGPTGGTHCEEVAGGYFPVTAVNVGSEQFTVTVPSRYSAPPTGNCASSSAGDYTSVINLSGLIDGLRVWSGGSAVQVGNIVIVGDETPGQNCFSIQDVGRLFITNNVGTYNCGGYGLYALYFSEINAGGTAGIAIAGGLSDGMFLEQSSQYWGSCNFIGNAGVGQHLDHGSVSHCFAGNSGGSYYDAWVGNGNSGTEAERFSTLTEIYSSAVLSDNGNYGYNTNSIAIFQFNGTPTTANNTSGNSNVGWTLGTTIKVTGLTNTNLTAGPVVSSSGGSISTGPITGSGGTIVEQTSPTLTTPIIATAIVSGLPACNNSNKGQRATVTDASSPTYLGILTGGSSTLTTAICNGSAWVAD